MEILTNIRTPKDLEAVSDNSEFIKIYYQHIEPNDLDYMFEDSNGFVRVIIW